MEEEESGLLALADAGFDPAQYLIRNPDLASRVPEASAALHYVRHGAAEGREAPFGAPLAQAFAGLRSAGLGAERLRLFIRGAALAEQRRQPRHSPEVARALHLLDAQGAYVPLLIVADSHGGFFTEAGFLGERLPIPFICSAGSAQGLSNRNSISGYGAVVRDLLDAAPGVETVFQFGQVDVEFVFDYRRVRRGGAAFDPTEFADFARHTADAYFTYLDEVTRGRTGVAVASILPPALDDAVLAAGYDNGHVNQLHDAEAAGVLREAMGALQRPDLAGRTRMHGAFNAELQARAAARGLPFLDLLPRLLGEDGVARREVVGPGAGADHHLDFGAPAIHSAARDAVSELVLEPGCAPSDAGDVQPFAPELGPPIKESPDPVRPSRDLEGHTGPPSLRLSRPPAHPALHDPPPRRQPRAAQGTGSLRAVASLRALFRSVRAMVSAREDAQLTLRDTDADWRLIGAEEPFWGVITAPEHRRDQLTPETLERFYETGRHDVEGFAELVQRASGRPLKGGRALDFGCGVGRVSEAMLDVADEVTGVDISPGMLETVRARSGRVTYLEALPDGEFDWVNSCIVLQHIPPARGLQHLRALLDRLAPGGAVTIQLPFAWEPGRSYDPSEAITAPAGAMVVYEYDLNAVFEALWTRGVRRHALAPTDHGGVYGFIIAGRRDAA